MLHGKQLLSAAVMVVLAGTPRVDHAQGKSAQTAPGWRNAPEYVRLFAPARGRGSDYRAYVSPLGLEAVLRALETDPSLLHPPGAWVPSALLPSEAFGQTGSYERWKMARLFGARRAQVARGPKGEGGFPAEAWTLVSPYPDSSLGRLEPGTLLIVLNLKSP